MLVKQVRLILKQVNLNLFSTTIIITYNYIVQGYYDEYGNWIEYEQMAYGPPDGNIHDGEGRLLNPELINVDLGDQEDPAVFISEFKPPRMVINYL